MQILRVTILIGLMLSLAGFFSCPQADAATKAWKPSQPARSGQIYIRQGARTVVLKQGDLIFRTALSLGDSKYGLYGIPKTPGIRLDPQAFEIYLFDPETAGEKIHLAKLSYVEAAPARAFDLKAIKVEPENFKKIYHVNSDDSMPIELWSVEKYIPLRITVLADRPGWCRLVPLEKLESGTYAINNGGIDGPRIFTGDQNFYPFMVAPSAPAPAGVKQTPTGKRRVLRQSRAVAQACPEPALKPAAKRPAPAIRQVAPPSAAKELAPDFAYKAITGHDPKTRWEYQITNQNDFPWHNVEVKIYLKPDVSPNTVLGPVTLHKDVVLPAHSVNQVQDKTFMQYETLANQGHDIYLTISSKEGTVKKAWKRTGSTDSGVNLIEIPWDLKE